MHCSRTFPKNYKKSRYDNLTVNLYRITGIDPLVDASQGDVFPLQLAFDTPIANFQMIPLNQDATSVPESNSLITLGLAAGFGFLKKRKIIIESLINVN